MGSETASQMRETRKITPMAAGAIPRTSVENFIRYMVVRKNMNPTPAPGAAQITIVERGRRSSGGVSEVACTVSNVTASLMPSA